VNAYADTSVLISLYTRDDNSEEALALFLDQEHLVPVTPFGEAEFVNTIELLVFRKDINASQAARTLLDFQKDLSAGQYLESRPVPGNSWERAHILSRRYTSQLGTRGMDAIHVAIALELGVQAFYTFDKDQAKLAKRAGLTVRPRR
jgi:predicted nucleic acid-binding protein